MTKIILLIFSINIFTLTNANAYVDPGSASIIVQLIIGVIAGALATIKLWWKKMINFFLKLFKTRKHK